MPNTLAPIEEVFAAMNSHVNYTCYKERKKEEIRVSPVTKAPKATEKSKSNVTTQKRHQKLRLHNDCGPT